MTMPFRQSMSNYAVAPCGEQQYKYIKKSDGKMQRVIDDTELPPTKKFELQNMIDAKVPLEEVSSYVVAGSFNQPSEPNED